MCQRLVVAEGNSPGAVEKAQAAFFQHLSQHYILIPEYAEGVSVYIEKRLSRRYIEEQTVVALLLYGYVFLFSRFHKGPEKAFEAFLAYKAVSYKHSFFHEFAPSVCMKKGYHSPVPITRRLKP